MTEDPVVREQRLEKRAHKLAQAARESLSRKSSRRMVPLTPPSL